MDSDSPSHLVGPHSDYPIFSQQPQHGASPASPERLPLLREKRPVNGWRRHGQVEEALPGKKFKHV